MTDAFLRAERDFYRLVIDRTDGTSYYARRVREAIASGCTRLRDVWTACPDVPPHQRFVALDELEASGKVRRCFNRIDDIATYHIADQQEQAA